MDVELRVGIQDRLVGEGLVADLVQSIGGVTDQFAKEDFLVGVEGVDNQGQELINLRLCKVKKMEQHVLGSDLEALGWGNLEADDASINTRLAARIAYLLLTEGVCLSLASHIALSFAARPFSFDLAVGAVASRENVMLFCYASSNRRARAAAFTN